MIDRLGWTGNHFALPDGKVVSPTEDIALEAVFKKRTQGNEVAGSLEQWQATIAEPLTGQPPPRLMIMLALSAPLLGAIGRHSLIVELVGPAAVGKSLAHRLAASVTGDIGELPLPFEDVMTALNRHAADHTGTLMRIDDPGTALAASSSARLTSNVRDAVVGLSGTDDVPTAVLIVGRKSLVDLVGPESPVAEVISGRSIVLRIGTERQLGIFDDVPENYASASAFAEALHTGIKPPTARH